MGEWKEYKLADLANLKNGKGLNNKFYTDFGKSGVWGANGQIAFTNEVLNSDPVVVIGRVGAYCGSVHMAEGNNWVTDNAIQATPRNDTDLYFLYYLLKNLNVSRAATGSAQPLITQSGIGVLECKAPSPKIQKEVASILSSLDDKIELNRKMNETLEEMARAIFKSWFVDFDPVHAKARGEKPAGMPDEIADLFPSEFVHSDQLNKPIPKGWTVKSLSQLAENVKRAVSADSIDPESNYIGLEHMPKRCIALTDWERAEKVTSNKFGFKTGEILFGKLRPYFHKVGVAPIDGICSTDILVIRPKKEKHFGVVLCAASSDAIITSVTSSSTGTKMPRTNWQDVSKFAVVIPDNEIIDSFNHHIKTLISKIINSIHENIVLTKTRDTMLPKLIRGEIEV
ncbi:MAG: restriction endonuclease subunit S [Deferribacterales bacterium]